MAGNEIWNGIYHKTNADHSGSVFKVLAMDSLPYLLKILIVSCRIFR